MNHPPAPAWIPTAEFAAGTNVAWLMKQAGVDSWDDLHAWSVRDREAYWGLVVERLGLRFRHPFERVADFSRGPEHPHWLPGARLNIVESCLAGAPDATAILHQDEGGEMKRMTRAQLAVLAGRVAAGLTRLGCRPGDRVALFLPMTAESVAIYLGIIQAGCVVVGIADSFRPPEIAVRLAIAPVSVVFTQENVLRGGKKISLYASVVAAQTPRAVVLGTSSSLARAEDIPWEDFLPETGTAMCAECAPGDAINVLFSSGTTGEPKAIPWTQTTPLKCAADAHFHQDVRPGDVLVWPTNIGWMMGPWLIFASLLNHAAMGLWQGAPVGSAFGHFVQDCGATLLGVIPTLVKTWRKTDSFHGCDLTRIRAFSSTGECSHADDMRWLMDQAGGRPVIEYCGGTEIGGGYITGVVTRPCVPGTFNAKALGLDFVIVNEAGDPATEGELFLAAALDRAFHHAAQPRPSPILLRGIPARSRRRAPATAWRSDAGVSRRILERARPRGRHHEPRRHQGQLRRDRAHAPNHPRPHGDGRGRRGSGRRSRPTRHLRGRAPIKAAEKKDLLPAMQERLNRDLNPLFKIHDVILVDALPRTASNKVMRRVLRDQYLSHL